MDFHRTWFIAGYLLLLIFFGGLSVYSFTQFGRGVRALPDELAHETVRVQRNGVYTGGVLPVAQRAPLHMVFAGDVMMSRHVDTLVQRAGSPGSVWELMADQTQLADIFFVNLEAPFSDVGPYDDENMVFHVRPEYVEGLLYAGVDVVSFANNHYHDAGDAGVEKTKVTLTENTIGYAVPGEPALVKKHGWTIGFTADAYNLGLDTEQLAADITWLKEQGADFVVSSMHAGVEYQKTPSRVQETYAHAAIDAGANLVVGHHPHVTQTTEEYNGGYIVYSLGNFIFDQFWSTETMRGAILEATLTTDGPQYTQETVAINTKAQPSILASDAE